MKALALLFALLCPSLALAEDVAVLLPNVAKSYTVTTDGKGGAVIVPLAGLVKPGDNPNPGPNPTPTPTPNPSPLTPFQSEIQRLTKAALAKGGTETTGAGISSVYSLAADGISAGTLNISAAADAVRRGTAAVVNLQKEQVAWEDFSDKLDDAITTLRAKGDLPAAEGTTPAEIKIARDKWVATFRDVAKGMDSATGFSERPATLYALRDNKDTQEIIAKNQASGVFGNIDIAKLIELIKLIVELFKLFSPAMLLVP
jgi:hypothetical protein